MGTAEGLDPYNDEIEMGAAWIGDWLALQLRERWPRAALAYQGAASSGSRWWRVDLGNGDTTEIAVTEPALLEPGIHAIPVELEKVDWRGALLDAMPEGVLVSSGARLFAWDRDRDRGTRLIEPR